MFFLYIYFIIVFKKSKSIIQEPSPFVVGSLIDLQYISNILSFFTVELQILSYYGDYDRVQRNPPTTPVIWRTNFPFVMISSCRHRLFQTYDSLDQSHLYQFWHQSRNIACQISLQNRPRLNNPLVYLNPRPSQLCYPRGPQVDRDLYTYGRLQSNLSHLRKYLTQSGRTLL